MTHLATRQRYTAVLAKYNINRCHNYAEASASYPVPAMCAACSACPSNAGVRIPATYCSDKNSHAKATRTNILAEFYAFIASIMTLSIRYGLQRHKRAPRFKACLWHRLPQNSQRCCYKDGATCACRQCRSVDVPSRMCLRSVGA